MTFLFDTNIILTYVRRPEWEEKFEERYRISESGANLAVSVVTVGELKSFAKQNQWGGRKLSKLWNLLDNYLILDINRPKILNAYAKIDAFSQGKPKPENPKFSSRNMGKNDLWIAATANVYDLRLFTTNGDFDHLAEDFVNLTKVDLSEFV